MICLCGQGAGIPMVEVATDENEAGSRAAALANVGTDSLRVAIVTKSEHESKIPQNPLEGKR